MEQIKFGVIVQLKSGGPKMTVSGIPSNRSTGALTCHWFVGDELKAGDFSKEELEVIVTEEKACSADMEA